MRQPLPVAIKTAFAWLGQSDPDKAAAAARKTYDATARTARANAGKARPWPANSPTTTH